jgi:hypothetical protein
VDKGTETVLTCLCVLDCIDLETLCMTRYTIRRVSPIQSNTPRERFCCEKKVVWNLERMVVESTFSDYTDQDGREE